MCIARLLTGYKVYVELPSHLSKKVAYTHSCEMEKSCEYVIESHFIDYANCGDRIVGMKECPLFVGDARVAVETWQAQTTTIDELHRAR